MIDEKPVAILDIFRYIRMVSCEEAISMLKQEFEYFLAHQKEFAEKYQGKFIVIKNQQVIGVYDSELDAVEETAKKEEIGTFLVQKCESGDASFTQVFHSRVSLA
jgi:hypothetical protein